MKEKMVQIWICSKCKKKDRYDYKEEPNLKKCLRCGGEMKTDKVIKIIIDKDNSWCKI